MNTYFEFAEKEFTEGRRMSLQSILAVLIGPEADPISLSLMAALGMDGLSNLSIEQLKRYEGVGESSATRIQAAFKLADILIKEKNELRAKIRSPKDAVKYLGDLKIVPVIHYDVLFLNEKNEIIGRQNISQGTLDITAVQPQAVFKEAFKLSSSSIILAHNCLTLDVIPSRKDVEFTQRMVEAGKIIGIEVLDHLIIGQERFNSMKEKGYIA